MKNTATHHIMTPRLKHQALSDPIEFFEKVLSFVGNGFTNQNWSTRSDDSHWIATSVRIDTVENMSSHFLLWCLRYRTQRAAQEWSR